MTYLTVQLVVDVPTRLMVPDRPGLVQLNSLYLNGVSQEQWSKLYQVPGTLPVNTGNVFIMSLPFL